MKDGSLTCNDCDLGLKFYSLEELNNHKQNFCAKSGFDDMVTLEKRLHTLQRTEPGTGNSALKTATMEMMHQGTAGMNKMDNNKKIFDLIKDMQASKDQDMKYRVEKEEINRAMKNFNKDQLNQLNDVKRNELGDLSNQRDVLRDEENQLKREVENMESKLIAQEHIFKQIERGVENESKDVK